MKTRRQFFLSLSSILATFAAGGFPRPGSCFGSEPPRIEILDTRVIGWKPPLYHGWPTLTRRADGELLLPFSDRANQKMEGFLGRSLVPSVFGDCHTEHGRVLCGMEYDYPIGTTSATLNITIGADCRFCCTVQSSYQAPRLRLVTQCKRGSAWPKCILSL